jgi:hypothetical protein
LLKGNCQRWVERISWKLASELPLNPLFVCKSEGQDFKRATERTWDSASLHQELYT